MSDLGIKCTICPARAPIEYHHTVPRSRGGENSLQIALCSNCHRSLHFNALAIVAKINNPKRLNYNKKFWASLEEEERALPYLQILVEAILKPIPEELSREHLLSISVPSTFFDQFKLLQLDLGLSSQDKVIEYCIKHMFRIRGIDNVSKTAPDDLWFLQ